MFSTKGKRKIQRKTANVRGYLGGGFQGMAGEADGCCHSEGDHSPMTSSCATPNKIQSQGSVLVEIPEELDIAEASREVSPLKDDSSHREQVSNRDSSTKSDSAAVAEIAKNLDDLDNYMMSVFYSNDDLSVYTKATTDSTTFSCSSSCSTVSTRRRHRGASLNRSKEVGKSHVAGSAWSESMKKSSMNIFVDGEEGWTPKLGWHMTEKKKEWDSKPEDKHWNKKDAMFDSMATERLEI